MKLLLAKVKKQFVAASINEKKKIVALKTSTRKIENKNKNKQKFNLLIFNFVKRMQWLA